MQDERRRSERHNWLRLDSKVCIKRTIFKKEWVPVVAFDYSHYGMGIQTDEVYHLGDGVCLSLDLVQERKQTTIPILKGIVRYKEKHHSRFNYGVEFIFASKAEKLSIDENLIIIEQALLKFEATRLTGKNNVESGV
ncbi:MAG: Tfp pilus assembly protein PilZ [Pseudohongiellaceae bacterium]|jgi:Tfp pilus assembly protein PilZ